jgi:hypothetical protein
MVDKGFHETFLPVLVVTWCKNSLQLQTHSQTYPIIGRTHSDRARSHPIADHGPGRTVTAVGRRPPLNLDTALPQHLSPSSRDDVQPQLPHLAAALFVLLPQPGRVAAGLFICPATITDTCVVGPSDWGRKALTAHHPAAETGRITRCTPHRTGGRTKNARENDHDRVI